MTNSFNRLGSVNKGELIRGALVAAAVALRAKSVPVQTVKNAPLAFRLTGGEVLDYKAAEDLMALSLASPPMLPAGKGYDGDAV